MAKKVKKAAKAAKPEKKVASKKANKKQIENLQQVIADAQESLRKLGVEVPEAASSSNDDGVLEFPNAKLLKGLPLAKLKAAAKSIKMETKGQDEDSLRSLLTTVAHLVAGDTDKIKKADAIALMKALSLKPNAKLPENLKLLASYFQSADEDDDDAEGDDDSEEDEEDSDEEDSDEEDSDEEDSDEEDDESEDDDEDEDSEDDEDESEDEEDSDEEDEEEDDEDSEDDEDESEDEEDDDDESEEEDADEDEESDDDDESEDDDEEEESDDDDDESVDADAVAAEAELPKLSVMKKQLAAYNKSAPKKERFNGSNVKKEYRKLLAKMVDSEGEIAEWGEPYIQNGDAMCCGVGLDAHKIKGKKGQFGKCVVTGKVFAIDKDGDMTEVEEE